MSAIAIYNLTYLIITPKNVRKKKKEEGNWRPGYLGYGEG